MSELYVPLTTVDEVKPHPNADRLDIAVIKGWQVVVGKDSVQAGDLVVYVPPDAVVPDELAEPWGVKPYLGSGNRVKAVKLRGEPSFGFAVPYAKCPAGVADSVKLDGDLSAALGITKYQPPLRFRGGTRVMAGDALPEDPRFARYTSIENLRHTPNLFDGIEVVITEKIHGANSRVGVIGGEWVAGSHRVQRKEPYRLRAERRERLAAEQYEAWRDALPAWKRWLHDGGLWYFKAPDLPTVPVEPSVYWLPLDIEGVASMMGALGRVHQQAILYGELYGPSVQALGYGVDQGQVAYVAFDLMLDGQFVDFDTFEALCRTFKVPMAPVVATGTATFDEIRQLSEGPTLLNGGPHYREGVVVKARTERSDPKFGRMVAKFVSDTYLTGKGEAAEDLASDAAEVA